MTAQRPATDYPAEQMLPVRPDVLVQLMHEAEKTRAWWKHIYGSGLAETEKELRGMRYAMVRGDLVLQAPYGARDGLPNYTEYRRLAKLADEAESRPDYVPLEDT